MKRLLLLGSLCSAAFIFNAAALDPAKAQPDQQVARLLKDVQAQQAAMIENQAKIDAKVAAIAEEIRTARIFANRAGR